MTQTRRERKSTDDVVVDPLVVKTEEVMEILGPLIEQEGITTFVALLGYSHSGFQETVKREYMAFGTADRWLTRIGLHHRLSDGSIRVVPNPNWSRQKFERYFLKRGDKLPVDLISLDEVEDGC